jgi:hypothetical protein
MKKWIGKVCRPPEDENEKRQYKEEMCIITEKQHPNIEVTYEIEYYFVYDNGQKSGNQMTGEWARTLGGAKRFINLDRGFKASDWTWKEINE